MNDFFRFPHTPHLAWLGRGSSRDDKVLTSQEASTLLSENVIVEEKLDGANLGISAGHDGTLRFQNRGQYITPPFTGQFARIPSWVASREVALIEALGEKLILFGEWCTARHSFDYRELPDWFLAFDIYDRNEARFWCTTRRDKLVTQLSLAPVPKLLDGPASVEKLKKLVQEEPSRFRPGPLEGIVIRKESPEWLHSRAKLVHPQFTQAITEHWSRRGLEWNQLISSPTLPPP